MLANNPQMQDQMRQMMPQLLQQMQNPDVQQMVTNPQALDAILQIQQGIEQLRSAAPGLLGNFGVPPMPASSSATTITATTGSNTNTTTTASGSNTTNTTSSAQSNPALFSEFMTRMMGSLASGANPNQPPEERYSQQLEILASMGFVNREANLQGIHIQIFV